MRVHALVATGVNADGSEYGGELEQAVETSETVVGCPSCGVLARCHIGGRRGCAVVITAREDLQIAPEVRALMASR